MFRRQIRWLMAHFRLVSLREAQQRMAAGRNDEPLAAITFDDGYADNNAAAIPLLIEAGIPCTYFVSTLHVLEGRPFPHDLARNRPLTPNSINDLRRFAAAGIEIGAHTRTHADLGSINNTDLLRDEIEFAARDLARAVDCSIRYFAFPYGQHRNLSPAAFACARGAGFAGVCSAYGGVNFPGDDPFHLQRIGPGESLFQLKNWCTIDPRMLKRTRRYEYRDATNSQFGEPACT
jgi:peptidoglycan/xylan/chitin deacetylase (PgdA/CDA1 family)